MSACEKAGKKLSVVARISSLLHFVQQSVLSKLFIEAQFHYHPLSWMFHGCKTTQRLKHLHERVLRLVYDDLISIFEELLQRKISHCVHHRNIQNLAYKWYKAKDNLWTQILREILQI